MQALLAAGLVAAAIAGGGAVSAAWWTWNTFIDNPGLVALERARCAAEVEAAASRAVIEEQLRIFKLGEAAFDKAYRQQQEDQAWHAAQLTLLQLEIEDYEQERQGEGRACPLTRRDIDFLDGVLDHRSTHPGGGG